MNTVAFEGEDEDEVTHRVRRRESIQDDAYWQRLWGNLLKAALVAVIGVLVREVVIAIEGPSSRTYDPYGV